MWDKRAHAACIVSNLCFDARVLGDWLTRLRRRDVTLPVYVGVAGPVQRARLLAMATKIGVGESGRFLAGHASWFLRFAAPSAGVAGLHLFTFNQVAETERWRRAPLDRLGG